MGRVVVVVGEPPGGAVFRIPSDAVVPWCHREVDAIARGGHAGGLWVPDPSAWDGVARARAEGPVLGRLLLLADAARVLRDAGAQAARGDDVRVFASRALGWPPWPPELEGLLP